MAEQIFERLPNVISNDIDDAFRDQTKVEGTQDQNSVSTDVNANSENTQTDSELFQSWQDVEQQYEAFQLDTLNFFKNDLLPNGLRKPDFPKSGIDEKIEGCRYRAKLYNEFRSFAGEEIRQRPRDPIIPNRVSEADLDNLDEILAGDYLTAKAPLPVSTALMPVSSNTNTTTTIQPSFLRKTFSDRPNPLAHLEFQNTPTIPNPVDHPKWELMRVISGHTGWVRCLDVDISNEWFVSGGNDRLIKVWDLATGTLKLTLTGHINTIRSVIISNRHAYLFSCGEDQMIKCWDLEYNKVIRHYHGHLSGIYCMTLHPSLEVLATGGRDATVRLWDIRTKMAVHVLSGHTGTVMSLVSQKYEPQIVSGSLDKMIRCWDIVAGKTTVVLTHHKKAIRSLAFHPTEYTFCSAGADNLKVWKLPKANFERNLENVNAIINSIAIKESNENQNVSLVIGGSDQGHLYFWDWKSGRLCQDIETIPQPGSLSSERAIYSVCLDKSETRLLTGECDKTIKVWRQKINEDYDEV